MSRRRYIGAGRVFLRLRVDCRCNFMIARFLSATIVLIGPQPSLAPLTQTPAWLIFNLRSRDQLDLADFLRFNGKLRAFSSVLFILIVFNYIDP